MKRITWSLRDRYPHGNENTKNSQTGMRNSKPNTPRWTTPIENCRSGDYNIKIVNSRSATYKCKSTHWIPRSGDWRTTRTTASWSGRSSTRKPPTPSVKPEPNYNNTDQAATNSFSTTIPEKGRAMLEGTSKKSRKSKECMIMCRPK